MDVNGHIKELMEAKGWTEYRMAKKSGLSNSTIANIFHRRTVPSISTLEAICSSFGITLAQFFAENTLYELDPEQKLMFDRYKCLKGSQKALVAELVDSYYDLNRF